MFRFTSIKRVALRAITASAAAGAIVVLAAAPADAAVFTSTHWTIDKDTAFVGRNPSSGSKAFNGTLETFHDGSRIRGRLKGDYTARGHLRVVWIFNSGSPVEQSDYTAGVHHVIDMSSTSGRDLVKVKLTLERNDGYGANLTELSNTYYVGDAPQSVGSCDQLDLDNLGFSNAQASFQGSVKWACDAASGRVTARIIGDLTRKSGATKNSYVGGHIFYADGTNSVFFSKVVTSSTTTQSLVPVASNVNKQARGVEVTLYGDNANTPGADVKFGDA